jgi:hypothetical protein
MNRPTQRQLSPSSLFLQWFRLFILFRLCDTHRPMSEQNNYKLLRTDTTHCNGSSPCFAQPQPGGLMTSADSVFGEMDDITVTKPTAIEFGGEFPCLTTQLFGSGTDLHMVRNQVSCQSFYYTSSEVTKVDHRCTGQNLVSFLLKGHVCNSAQYMGNASPLAVYLPVSMQRICR